MTTDNRTNGQTPNPTAEQIIEDALRNSYASGSALARLIVSDLHAHGLLSGGAPSEEQIERAGDAIFELRMDYAGEDGLPSDRSMAIAALVAAQGAAPQALTAERVREVIEEHSVEHYHIDYGYGMFTTDVEEIAKALAAPVPSGAVDEDKLAEVIRKLRFYDAPCWADGIDCTESVSDHADDIASAVAEWLKGQGR